jgi:hypothetical protein
MKEAEIGDLHRRREPRPDLLEGGQADKRRHQEMALPGSRLRPDMASVGSHRRRIRGMGRMGRQGGLLDRREVRRERDLLAPLDLILLKLSVY